MKAVSLLSGGKDSFLSLNIATMLGMDVVATITVLPKEDSYMFHHPNASLGSVVSQCLGIRNITSGEEEFESVISTFGGHLLVAGAVRSDYQRSKLEEICVKYGLVPFFPLWRREDEQILLEFIDSGSRGIFTSVAAEGLDESLLGKEIDQNTLKTLKSARERYGISLVGEGGEYETLVICSTFESCCIAIDSSSVVDRGLQKNLMIKKYRVIPLSGSEKRPTDP
ncbi:MAG: diphthine--ammonia ligase [Thermoplasmata archaeon]